MSHTRTRISCGCKQAHQSLSNTTNFSGRFNLCAHSCSFILSFPKQNSSGIRLKVMIDLDIVFRGVLVDIGLPIVVCLVDLVLHGVTSSSNAGRGADIGILGDSEGKSVSTWYDGNVGEWSHTACWSLCSRCGLRPWSCSTASCLRFGESS